MTRVTYQSWSYEFLVPDLAIPNDLLPKLVGSGGGLNFQRTFTVTFSAELTADEEKVLLDWAQKRALVWSRKTYYSSVEERSETKSG